MFDISPVSLRSEAIASVCRGWGDTLAAEQREHERQLQLLRAEIASLKSSIAAAQRQRDRSSREAEQRLDVVRAAQRRAAALQLANDEARGTLGAVEAEVGAVQRATQELEELIRGGRRSAAEAERRERAECARYELYLGLKVEAVAVDVLRFRFANVDAANAHQQVWCELAVESGYEVGRSSPELLGAERAKLQDELARSQDLAAFLKGVRGALRRQLQR